MSGRNFQVVRFSVNPTDSGYARAKSPTRSLVCTDQGRSPVPLVATLFWCLALCGGFYTCCHCDASCSGRHRRDSLSELDLHALPAWFSSDGSHRRLDGNSYRDCQGPNLRRIYLRYWLCNQRLRSGYDHHDPRTSPAGYGRWRTSVTCIHRCVHPVSEKTMGTDHCRDFRSLGSIILVWAVDRGLFCSSGKLAWGVLGVCGTGIGGSAGGTSALKAEIPDAKGTDPDNAPGSAGTFRSCGACNLSSGGGKQHRSRQCLVLGRNGSVVVFLKTGRGQRKPDFSAWHPQPPDSLRFRTVDDILSLHGHHLADGLWSTPHVHHLWSRAFSGWLYHCFGVTGLDSRSGQHIRC